jgi:hypothetical protein
MLSTLVLFAMRPGMQEIRISIGIMPLKELRAEMIAVARGERKIAPDEPKLWFESLQALADALKTDVATVERVLLPPPESDVAIEAYNGDVDENGSFGDHARGFSSLTDATETPGPAHAEGRENSILPNLSPDARALATYMSDLSEELWCAGWMRDLEFMLWSVVEGADASLTLTRDEVAKLKSLSNACKGWIVFRRDSGETFVSMPEWMHLFAAWLSEKDSTDKSESK